MEADSSSSSDCFLIGLDASYSRDDSLQIGAAVALRFPRLDVVSVTVAYQRDPAPYRPGFFSEREGDLFLSLIDTLAFHPEVVFVHGHGRVHPKRSGLAVYVGERCSLPTVGVADQPLCGTWKEPEPYRGDHSLIVAGNEILGARVRTVRDVRPVTVSTGFGILLEDAIDWVLKTSIKFRMPEPIRQAHMGAGKARKNKIQEERKS
ncbi:MAG TPA: endonuclease V [Thermoanaerobaculia bacterium]|nr:endonuclease V [Thermoanaerobaculia bacterium]HUM28689.1 endonuclease V [Thermoanaerobaculia bacterium]HXK66703.1 endonuclease V [Thermoanaerobaculia bacterium]